MEEFGKIEATVDKIDDSVLFVDNEKVTIQTTGEKNGKGQITLSHTEFRKILDRYHERRYLPACLYVEHIAAKAYGVEGVKAHSRIIELYDNKCAVASIFGLSVCDHDRKGAEVMLSGPQARILLEKMNEIANGLW